MGKHVVKIMAVLLTLLIRSGGEQGSYAVSDFVCVKRLL
jgi:hypothetical protein